MRTTKGTSLWLIPSGDFFERCKHHISDFSSALGGPVFFPHMTLLGELEIEPERVIEVAHRLVPRTLPVTTSGLKLAAEENPFRALYLQLDRTRGIRAIHEAFCRELGLSSEVLTWNPHISFYYGSPTQPQKAQMVAALEHLSFENIEFLKLVVMATKGYPQEWYPITQIERGQK